jgi:hypothetical protein
MKSIVCEDWAERVCGWELWCVMIIKMIVNIRSMMWWWWWWCWWSDEDDVDAPHRDDNDLMIHLWWGRKRVMMRVEDTLYMVVIFLSAYFFFSIDHINYLCTRQTRKWKKATQGFLIWWIRPGTISTSIIKIIKMNIRWGACRSHKYVCHEYFGAPRVTARRPIFRPFWGLFEGSKKGWKMTKNRRRDEKITSPHATKNFLAHKIRHSIPSNYIKINKINKEPKNTKKWRFLTPFQKPPKTAIFSPFLRVSKNDDFFVINDVNNKNFWWKSRSRKKSGTSILGRGRGGSPLIFSWKSSRWYL